MILRLRLPTPNLRILPHPTQIRHATQIQSSAQLADLQRQARALDNFPKSAPKQQGSDRLFYFTTLGLFLATPPVVWFWYQHRKEHMGKKKGELIRLAEEKRREFLREKGKG